VEKRRKEKITFRRLVVERSSHHREYCFVSFGYPELRPRRDFSGNRAKTVKKPIGFFLLEGGIAPNNSRWPSVCNIKLRSTYIHTGPI